MTKKRVEGKNGPAGPQSYSQAVKTAEEEIRRELLGVRGALRPLLNHLARSPGKNIRARALLACAMRKDGLIPPEAVRLSAAIEIVHLATLVHDDVVDNADMRRGAASLNRKFGDKPAVLCGDYLFCLALRIAAENRVPEDRASLADKTLPGYLMDVLSGQLEQTRNTGNLSLSEREYFRIIRGKTAAMFKAAFHVGFLCSDEPEELKDAFSGIGEKTGLIFQMSDDCADYESTRKEAGKPVMADFAAGVVTLPLIYALRADGSLKARIERGIDPGELKRLVEASGGLERTRLKIGEYYRRTADAISSLPVIQEKRDLLMGLLDASAGRRAAMAVGETT